MPKTSSSQKKPAPKPVSKTSKKPAPAKEPQDNPFDAYLSLGLDFHHAEGDEQKTTCPFCKKNSLHVNKTNGLFHCKSCTKSGNKYTFLQYYYDHWKDRTSDKHLEAIAMDRDLPIEAFQDADIAYDKSQAVYLIPVQNEKGSMVNLGRWDIQRGEDGKSRPVYSLKGCKVHLFNLASLASMPTVWLCEGPWDQISLNYLFAETRCKDSAVLAVPGASTFKPEWTQYFEGKHVVLCYDNDDPGKKGLERTAKLLQENCRLASLSKIVWPESYPSGFDLRDFVSKYGGNPERCMGRLWRFATRIPLTKSKAKAKVTVKCETIQELYEECAKAIHLSKEIEDTLAVIISVVLSNKIFKNPYCPLWLFIVGPSGSGKTMLLQSTSDLEHASWQTSLTPKTLISGYKTSDGSDPSLLPALIGKTLIIEDFTGIMGLPAGEQDEIYGVLRSVYNGRYEKPYGHMGISRVYPAPDSEHETCHFTILAGVTGAIHADRRANHGERFLKYHMMVDNEDYNPLDQIQRSIDNTLSQSSPEQLLRPPVSAFVEHKFAELEKLGDKFEPAAIPERFRQQIIGLAQTVAMVRAVVVRKQGELVVRPEAEIGTRIAQQLIKFAQALAFTYGKSEIDEEVYRLVKRVGLDTCYGWHRDVLLAIAHAGDKGILHQEICAHAIIGSSTCRRCIDDLFELGAIEFKDDKGPSSVKGRKPQRWFLTPAMKHLVSLAEIHSIPKPVGATLEKLLDKGERIKLKRKKRK
jgi:hypothetical protein